MKNGGAGHCWAVAAVTRATISAPARISRGHHSIGDNLKRVPPIVNGGAGSGRAGYFTFTRMTSRSITPQGYLVHSLTQCLASGAYHISYTTSLVVLSRH